MFYEPWIMNTCWPLRHDMPSFNAPLEHLLATKPNVLQSNNALASHTPTCKKVSISYIYKYHNRITCLPTVNKSCGILSFTLALCVCRALWLCDGWQKESHPLHAPRHTHPDTHNINSYVSYYHINVTMLPMESFAYGFDETWYTYCFISVHDKKNQ